MDIIKHSGHEPEYSLFFEQAKRPGSGFSFLCDKEGNVFLDRLQPIERENLEKCLKGEYEVIAPCVKSESYWRPAVGRCECGEELELQSSWANTCKCGREYNMSGQLLAPRNQWEESWDDDNPHLPWGVMGPDWD